MFGDRAIPNNSKKPRIEAVLTAIIFSKNTIGYFCAVNSCIALVQPHIPAGPSLGIEKSPVSIQIIAAQLQTAGYSVQMYHAGVDEALVRDIVQFNPSMVGISAMTANYTQAKLLARMLKHSLPEAIMVLGGWHATGCVQAYLNNQETESAHEMFFCNSPFDYIVAGEGDRILIDLCSCLSDGRQPHDLPGVCYAAGAELKLSVAEQVLDLDTLSDPIWKGLPVDTYRDQRTGMLDLSCHFNRACRFNCGFCATPTMYGRGVRRMSAHRAVEQIEHVVSTFRPQVITFTDEDFFASVKWVEQLVALIEQSSLHDRFGVSFDSFASVNDLYQLEKNGRGDLLDRMKGVGFNSLTIGIESFNPHILRTYNKELMILPTMSREQQQQYRQADTITQDRLLVNHYLECVQRAITFAQQHGLIIVGDYIIGNLDETIEQVRNGFGKFMQLRDLHVAYLPVFTPFPGTALWKSVYHSGKLIRSQDGTLDWSRFDASKSALDLGYDVESLRNELEVAFYTSERYQQDMKAALRHDDSTKLTLFRSRFSRLHCLFPDNVLIAQRMEELDATVALGLGGNTV